MGESGDFSRLDSNAAKRQHFVPRLLLDRFCRTQASESKIFQMETGSRRAPQRINLKSAASRHRLYRAIEEGGAPTNRIEGYFALVESHAAPALDRMLAHPTSLSDADRATLSLFVSLQMMRTPAAEKQILELANSAFQNHATAQFSDKRAFAEQYRKQYGDLADDDQIERFRQEMMASIREGKVRLGDAGGAAFAAGIQHAAEQVPLIFSLDWSLLQCPGAFVTSDRAFAIHDPTPPSPWATQGLLSSENVEVTMPLSEDACLLIRPLDYALSTQSLSPHEAETINLRTYGWAETYVFGPTQESLVDLRLAARRRISEIVRPKPFCNVVLIERDPDDDSLAQENRRNGWPEQLSGRDGVSRDYIVIPTDGPHPELRRRASRLIRSRAGKRAGYAEDEPFEGRETIEYLMPWEALDA